MTVTSSGPFSRTRRWPIVAPAIYEGSRIPPRVPTILGFGPLFQFMHAWGDYLGPLIFLRSEEQFTIALGLQRFLGGHMTEWGYLMAASTMATLPIVLLFFFTQRTFIEGISLTGVKG